MTKNKLAIIGGSGLYEIEGLESPKWKTITTQYEYQINSVHSTTDVLQTVLCICLGFWKSTDVREHISPNREQSKMTSSRKCVYILKIAAQTRRLIFGKVGIRYLGYNVV